MPELLPVDANMVEAIILFKPMLPDVVSDTFELKIGEETRPISNWTPEELQSYLVKRRSIVRSVFSIAGKGAKGAWNTSPASIVRGLKQAVNKVTTD